MKKCSVKVYEPKLYTANKIRSMRDVFAGVKNVEAVTMIEYERHDKVYLSLRLVDKSMGRLVGKNAGK